MRPYFQGQAVEFPSAYGLTESVGRLKGATRRSVLSDMAHQSAVGRVSERRVRLQRCIPLIGNAIKPFFFGRFVERDGAVVLVGQFRMLWVTRVFFVVWFGVLTVGTISWAVAREPHRWAAVGGCLVMYAAGALAIGLGKWFSRNDVAYLSGVIRDALAPDSVTLPALQVSHRQHVHRWIALGCAALAALYFTALGSTHVLPAGQGSGLLAERYRIEAVVDAVLLAVMAISAWRKQLFAWQLRFVFLGLGWIQMLLQGLGGESAKVPVVISALVTIGSTIVLGILGWWWYAQRAHFASRP